MRPVEAAYRESYRSSHGCTTWRWEAAPRELRWPCRLPRPPSSEHRPSALRDGAQHIRRDMLYALDELLTAGKMPADLYLRRVRQLTREQFKAREIMRKIAAASRYGDTA